MVKKDRQDGDALPRRQGFFLGSRRQHSGSQDDGWTDKKREQEEPPASAEHVARHSKGGFPVGKRNP